MGPLAGAFRMAIATEPKSVRERATVTRFLPERMESLQNMNLGHSNLFIQVFDVRSRFPLLQARPEIYNPV